MATVEDPSPLDLLSALAEQRALLNDVASDAEPATLVTGPALGGLEDCDGNAPLSVPALGVKVAHAVPVASPKVAQAIPMDIPKGVSPVIGFFPPCVTAQPLSLQGHIPHRPWRDIALKGINSLQGYSPI